MKAFVKALYVFAACWAGSAFLLGAATLYIRDGREDWVTTALVMVAALSFTIAVYIASARRRSGES